MKKILQWLLIGMALVVLVACGGSSENDSVAHAKQTYTDINGNEQPVLGYKPDVEGFGFIEIYNNANIELNVVKSLAVGSPQADIHAVLSISVHCVDYQYSNNNLVSHSTTAGVNMKLYVKGNSICSETTYETTAAAHGMYSILIAD